MIGRGPEGWDQRHRERGPDPGAPEPALVDTLGPLPAGRAVDLGSGAGRHALWLAARGWDVTAVDFSAVGAERGRAAAARLGLAVDWVVADARDWVPAVLPVDLVLTARVKLPTTVLQAAGGWLAPGGHLVVLGHAAVVTGRAAAVVPGRTSAGEPADGPRDPALRHTPDGLLEAAAGLVVERLEHVPRDGRPGALDLLLVARRDTPPPYADGMPRYDYRCRTCDSRFEVRRAMSDPAGEAPCPQGHLETSRVFTPVAVGGAAAAPAPSGGCCGGGCCA